MKRNQSSLVPLSWPMTLPAAAVQAAVLILVASACNGVATDPGAPAAAASPAGPSAPGGPTGDAASGADVSTLPRVDVPQGLDPYWIDSRRQEQLAAKANSGVFRDFQFANRQVESGITHLARVTDDSGKTFIASHYDHGTGMAVADVDGDGLTDLYFVRQVGPNELWRNVGGGKFEDITAAAGVAVPDKIGSAASFADLDNDGDADLYATTIQRGNEVFENDGTGRFTNVTDASGLGYFGFSAGALFFDYDRDGRLDLFLANTGTFTTDPLRTSTIQLPGVVLAAGELEFYTSVEDAFGGHLKAERNDRSLLFHNEGGLTFKDVTAQMGIDDLGWTGDASVIDGNEDGWPDLYALNMQGNDGY
ncbi:MAG: VCBS repeat-containing protein [Ardenticatenales bacterium]|nr:VCBS repeat-containing protein [Ardenticatenales bacterium]